MRNTPWGALNKNENAMHTYGRVYTEQETRVFCRLMRFYPAHFLKYARGLIVTPARSQPGYAAMNSPCAHAAPLFLSI